MLRNSAISIFIAIMLTACGGGGSGTSDPISGGDTQTATVGVIVTDASSDDFDEVIATITSVELLCENGEQTLFSGSATFDLLRLTEFVEMLTVAEGIQPDTCNKIRLQLDSLKLNVLHDDGTVDEENSVVAKLVANGKMDLLARPAFTIHPGETLFVSLDFDVDRSLKITETGSGQFIVRPVIFVKVGESPGFKKGLTRVFGIIDEINADASRMRICMDALTAQPISINTADNLPERCLLVALDNDTVGSDTGVFGQNGLPIQANELVTGNPVTVVGLLAIADDNGGLEPTPLAMQATSDGDRPPALPFILEAIVVERGRPGTFLHLAGRLQSGIDPVNDSYELLLGPGQGFAPDSMLTGQLFTQSRIIDPDGTDIDRTTLQAGDRTRVDGVLLLQGGDIAENTLRTALMIVRQGASINPPDSEQDILIGTIQSINKQTFMVTPIGASTGDRCVNGQDAVVLFLVESDGAPLDVIKGTVDDLSEGIKVTIFGTENSGGSFDSISGCFDADLIISRAAPKPPEQP